MIVWEDDDLGVFGQEFDAAGNKVGGQFQVSISDPMEKQPRVAVRDGGYLITWFGAGEEPDDDIFGRNYIVPEPGASALGLAALATLAALTRARRSRPLQARCDPLGGLPS